MTDTINLTVKETVAIMRDYGFEIGDAFLEEGIKQGKFPFAIAIQGRTWRYYISRPLLIAFLKKWAGQ